MLGVERGDRLGAGEVSVHHLPAAVALHGVPRCWMCFVTAASACWAAVASVRAARPPRSDPIRSAARLPWVAAQGVSTHWLRHTTLTWVERHFGYGVARAYAGHTDSRGAATTTYIKADLQAVATALAAMTGQPHPVATAAG